MSNVRAKVFTIGSSRFCLSLFLLNVLPCACTSSNGDIISETQNELMCKAWKASGLQNGVKTKHDFVALLNTTSEFYQSSKVPFHFIEVGANDGMSFADRVRPYVQTFEWTGVCLEPLPEHYARLQETYKPLSKTRKVALVNKAISLDGGVLVIWSVSPLSVLPKWFRGVSSVDKALVEHQLSSYMRYNRRGQRRAAHLAKRVKLVPNPVAVTTFPELRNEHNLPNMIEYFQVDAEGLDFKVLKNFNLATHGAMFIQYEHAHFPEEEVVEAQQYLTDNGYQFVSHSGDTLAVNTKRMQDACTS